MGNLRAEVIILKKEQRNKKELERVELGSDLNPDDLDFRSNNHQTKEQKNNFDLNRKIDLNASKKNK